jgi:hypothetical protein
MHPPFDVLIGGAGPASASPPSESWNALTLMVSTSTSRETAGCHAGGCHGSG